MEIKEVKFLKSIVEFEREYNPLSAENNRKRIFFLWRSNVGKSSLINSLLWKKDLAYAWAKAWKTRSINIFLINNKYECMDFPWYWYAVWWVENRNKLRDMILNYLQDNEHKDLKIILIIDAYVWPTKLDEEIYDYITAKGFSMIIVLNKVDKTKQSELEKTLIKCEELFPETEKLLYSCRTGKYRNETLRLIFN